MRYLSAFAWKQQSELEQPFRQHHGCVARQGYRIHAHEYGHAMFQDLGIAPATLKVPRQPTCAAVWMATPLRSQAPNTHTSRQTWRAALHVCAIPFEVWALRAVSTYLSARVQTQGIIIFSLLMQEKLGTNMRCADPVGVIQPCW